MTISQRCEVFPERDVLGEIQDIPQDWITFWTRWIRQSGFPPLPEGEDRNTEQEYAEHGSVKHGSREGEWGEGGCSGSYTNTPAGTPGTLKERWKRASDET